MDLCRVKELEDALDHIARTSKASRTQTRRLRWIAERASSAINGDDKWKDIDLPRNKPLSQRESKMKSIINKHLSEDYLRDLK